jgi:uncharacterized membrane protein
MFKSSQLKNYLLAGLLVWIPIAVTIGLLQVVINLLSGLGVFSLSFFFKEAEITKFFATQSIFIKSLLALLVASLAVTVITATGWFVANVLGRFIVRIYEFILDRIPLVNVIYSATKQVLSTLFSANASAFRQVVMVPFPHPGSYAVGFVTGDAAGEMQEKTEKFMLMVFIPTTPNPTSGFLFAVPKEDVIPLKMSPEEAVRVIVSLGMISPQGKPLPPEALKAATKEKKEMGEKNDRNSRL